MFDDLADGEVRETDLLVAFYDITGYMHAARSRGAAEVLRTFAGYFDVTGGIIQAGGGRLIKTIGDAGLCVFADANAGIPALMRLQAEGDRWLAEHDWRGNAVVKANYGPVAVGRVGAPGEARIDVYGETVNTAALVDAREPRFAITAQAFRKLDAATRKLFKKHTPPIAYIPASAQKRPSPHARRPI